MPPIDGDGDDIARFWGRPKIWRDGLTQETCRDNNHHAQYGMASALHAAEVAWNQGVDVYAEHRERYTAAMELMAEQFLTGSMLGVCANDVTSRELYATWEIGYNHYHHRMGLSLPRTRKLLREQVRVRGVSEWNIFYETLTHAKPDSNLKGGRKRQNEASRAIPAEAGVMATGWHE